MFNFVMSIQKVKMRLQSASRERTKPKNINKNLLQFDFMSPSKSVNMETNRVLLSRPINLKNHLYETSKQVYQSQRMKVWQNPTKTITLIQSNIANPSSRYKSRASTPNRNIQNSCRVALNRFQTGDCQDLVISNVFKKEIQKDDKCYDLQYHLNNTQVQDAYKIKDLNFDKAKTSYKKIGSVFSYGVNSHKKDISIFDEKEVRICVVTDLYRLIANAAQITNSPRKGEKYFQLSFFAIYQTKQKGPYIQFIRQKFHRLLMENTGIKDIIHQQDRIIRQKQNVQIKLSDIINLTIKKIQSSFLENLGSKKLKPSFLLDGDFNFSIALVSGNFKRYSEKTVFLFKKGINKAVFSFNFGESTQKRVKILHQNHQKVVQKLVDNYLSQPIRKYSDYIKPTAWQDTTNSLVQHSGSKNQRMIRLSQSKYNSMRKDQISNQLNKYFETNSMKNGVYLNESKKTLQVKVIPVNDQMSSPDFLVLGSQGLSFSRISEQQIKKIVWKHMLTRSSQQSFLNNKKRLQGLASSAYTSQKVSGAANLSSLLTGNSIMNVVSSYSSLSHDWTGQAVDQLIFEALSTNKVNTVSAILLTFKNMAQTVQTQQSTIQLPFLACNR